MLHLCLLLIALVTLSYLQRREYFTTAPPVAGDFVTCAKKDPLNKGSSEPYRFKEANKLQTIPYTLPTGTTAKVIQDCTGYTTEKWFGPGDFVTCKANFPTGKAAADKYHYKDAKKLQHVPYTLPTGTTTNEIPDCTGFTSETWLTGSDSIVTCDKNDPLERGKDTLYLYMNPTKLNKVTYSYAQSIVGLDKVMRGQYDGTNSAGVPVPKIKKSITIPDCSFAPKANTDIITTNEPSITSPGRPNGPYGTYGDYGTPWSQFPSASPPAATPAATPVVTTPAVTTPAATPAATPAVTTPATTPAATTPATPATSSPEQPDNGQNSVPLSDIGYTAMELQKKKTFLEKLQKIVRQEILNSRNDPNNNPLTVMDQCNSSSTCTQQGQEYQQVDMSKYIKKDSIPCWGCTLDY